MRAALLSAVLVLGGGAAMPRDVGAERIVYETRAGGCVVCSEHRLTVDSDGSVVLETRERIDPYQWRNGSRSWRISREQYAAFRERLRPVRPNGERTARDGECDLYLTHSGAIAINWHGGGREAKLLYDLGCYGKQVDAMREAIESAPALAGAGRLLPGDEWRPDS